MKKALKVFITLFVVLAVFATTTLITVFDVVTFCLYITGSHYNVDLATMGIFTLPIIAYIYYNVITGNISNQIKSLLNNQNYG